MFLTLLALLPLGETISFENSGIRLELFLKELSRQSGNEFQCSPPLKNEVLAASFQNQSLDIVKTQLAKVIHGTWEKRDDGWWLVQSDEQKREERDWNTASHNTIIQTTLDSLKPAMPLKDWTANDAEKHWIQRRDSQTKGGENRWNAEQRQSLQEQSPGGRFMASLYGAMKPSMLWTEPSPIRQYSFSANGLRNHSVLQVDMQPALERYRNEATSLQALAGTNLRYSQVANFELEFYNYEVPMAYVVFYDKQWKIVATHSTWPLPDSLFAAEPEPFQPSRSTIGYMKLFTETYEQPGNSDFDAKLKESPIYRDIIDTLLHATVKDPLGLAAGKCWIDFAKIAKKPLLVNLEEEVEERRPEFFVPKIDPDRFVVGMRREDSDGWVLARPANPVRNRTMRFDRKSIERLAAILASPKSETLESKLARQDLWYQAFTFANGVPFGIYLQDRTSLEAPFAAAGTLTSDQLRQCLNGKTVLVTDLPGRAQEYIYSRLVGSQLNQIALGYKPGGQEAVSPRLAFPNGLEGIRLGIVRDGIFTFEFEKPVFPKSPTFCRLPEMAALIIEAEKQRVDISNVKFKMTYDPKVIATLYGPGGKKSFDLYYVDDSSDVNGKMFTLRTLPDLPRRQIQVAMKGMLPPN